MHRPDPQKEAFRALIGVSGEVTPESIQLAEQEAFARGVPLARVLLVENKVAKKTLLNALSIYYECPVIEYDERLPVPPDLLTAVAGKITALHSWFPVIKEEDGTVVVAAVDPTDPELHAEVEAIFAPAPCRYRVALPDDIQWFAQDLLNGAPGKLIGTERTGHAFWRNTMAQWRTRLACYRTDMAKARTSLVMARDGLALGAIAATLLRTPGIQEQTLVALVV
ncbi:MAG: hypothetical protein OEL66_05150, partial [Desulfobulbaceae bacterium]|nr:hypothetical protein [Desulfobulbaceae bacterium]